MFAVPLISLSVMGLLMSIPRPIWFMDCIDWSTPFIIGALAFYFSFRNLRLIVVIILFFAVQLLILNWMKPQLFLPCLLIFILAWIAQFYGHHLEGKKPAFFKDLFFLLIGPLWVLKSLKFLK